MRRFNFDLVPLRVLRSVLGVYLRSYHRLEIRSQGALPVGTPVLALTSHFSVLDTVACMVADPWFPKSTFVVKESLLRVPVVRQVLRSWGAVSVARDGGDLGALRQIINELRLGNSICIAAEGTRSRTGRLGAMNRVLVKLALDLACKGTPVIPVVETGTYEALPPGAWLPRPYKIRVVAGDPIDLRAWCGRRLTEAELSEVGAAIQRRLALLLPPERRPAPSTPALTPAV